MAGKGEGHEAFAKARVMAFLQHAGIGIGAMLFPVTFGFMREELSYLFVKCEMQKLSLAY